MASGRVIPEDVQQLAVRNARFEYARRRVVKIADGWPRLTADQLRELEAILQAAREGGGDGTA
jgi:hypothetical protein